MSIGDIVLILINNKLKEAKILKIEDGVALVCVENKLLWEITIDKCLPKEEIKYA